MVPLTATVCRACGLDLRHPASAELAKASAAAADALDARLDIIGRIRRETAAAAVSAPPAATPAAAPPAAVVTAPAATPTAAPLGADEPATTPVPATKRRSGIQIGLVVVGISLLSVFAVFGLVYAFVTYGSLVRMTIISAGTLATMVAAGVLKRRGLDATGEGVAVLGTVMLALVSWAVRLNDPNGLGRVDEALYWGIALLVVGVICVLWSFTNRLATPVVVAAALLPISVGLITGHLVGEALPATGIALTAASIAAFATAAVSWMLARPAHPATRRAARVTAQSLGAVAAATALVSIVPLDEPNRWAPLIGGVIIAAVAGLHLATTARELTSPRRAIDTVLLVSLGGGAAVAAVSGAVLSVLRFDDERVIVSAPVIAAVAVALAAEQGWRRLAADSPWRTAFSGATVVAAVLSAIVGALTALAGMRAFVEASTRALGDTPLSLDSIVSNAGEPTGAALGALALCLGLAALSWASLGVLVRRARVLTLIGAILAVAIVPVLGPWWLVMLTYAVFAVGAAVALHRVVRATTDAARHAALALAIPLTAGSAFGAFLIGWAVPRGWIIGLIIALLTIGIARPATPNVALRAAAVGLAAALLLGSVPRLASDAAALGLPEIGAGAALLFAGALIIVLSQSGTLAAVERIVAGAVSLSVGLVVTLGVALAALPGATSTERVDDVAAVAALAVALAVVVVRRTMLERTIARAVLPLVVVTVALAAAAPFGLDAVWVGVIAVGALIVVVALGLIPVVANSGSSRFDRVTADIVAAVLAALIAADAMASSAASNLHWAALLALALFALVTAISRDGLFGSRSPRRFIGWLALALATLALWMQLADAGADDPEPYALPLAGAVLLIAAVNALVTRRARAAGDRTAAPLTAGALLVALLPTALASPLVTGPDGSFVRGSVVAVVATLLALVPHLAAKRIDSRLPSMTAALVSAGLVALGVLALAHTVDVLAVGAAVTGVDLVRACLIVTVPSLVAVASWMLAAGRLRHIAVAATAGVAALSAGLLGLAELVDPVELVSVPLALALIAIGAMKMSDNAAARSWPWLAPGVVALLAPSLFAIDGAGEPLWRAVALGVTAALVFVLAVRLRLQAPFVLGGTVLLIHLLVQSWPLLERVGRAVEWWLWLGLAGVLVVALAARYERRLQNVRDMAERISHLR